MYPHQREAFVDLAEGLAENAAPDPVRRWALGMAAALALATYGAYCLVVQRAWVPQTRPLGIHQWHGPSALAVGCLLVSLAAFIHCHWFWSNHPYWHGFGQLGKLIAAVGAIASIAWLLYEVFFANL